MTTRLDRLLNLLSTGANASTRQTAATQLGSIAAQRVAHSSRPSTLANWRGSDGEWNQVSSLLARVLPFLCDKSFDTRQAASQAIDAICSSVGIWDPSLAETASSSELADSPVDYLRLDNFDLYTLLNAGTELLSSSGQEYVRPAGSSLDPKQAHQEVMANLGLGKGIDTDLDLELDISKELQEGSSLKNEDELDVKPQITSKASTPAIMSNDEEDITKLSAREKAALKLKRKRKAGSTPVPSLKKAKMESTPIKEEGQLKLEEDSDSKVVISHKPKATKIDSADESTVSSDLYTTEPHTWPFEKLVIQLKENLISPSWETRHGSALGLLAIIRRQGENAGKELGLSKKPNDARHALWTEDLAFKLLHVLCLDRFGDYVGDTVLAPVREATSTCFAALFKVMTTQNIEKVRIIFSDMVKQDRLSETKIVGKKNHIWQVRHAGLSGLKYLVAVNQDSVKQPDQLAQLLNVTLIGLKDSDDDVRLAAAETLIPVSGLVVAEASSSLKTLLETLTRCLSDLKDDLSSSIGSVMLLLSSLLSHKEAMTVLRSLIDVQAFIPLAFPYFRHTISSVRLAVLKMLQLFLKTSESLTWIDVRLLCLLYQNIVVEEKFEINQLSQVLALELLEAVNSASSPGIELVEPALNAWFGILMTPLGQPFEPTYFFRPEGVYGAGITAHSNHNVDKSLMNQDLSLVGEEQILKGRMAAAKILAFVMCTWPVSKQTIFEQSLLSYFHSQSALQRYLSSTLIQEWSNLSETHNLTPNPVMKQNLAKLLLDALDSPGPPVYTETQAGQSVLQNECEALLMTLAKVGKLQAKDLPSLPKPFTLDFASQLIASLSQLTLKMSKINAAKAQPRITEQQSKTINLLAFCTTRKERHDIQYFSGIANACIALKAIPIKLNPLIKSLMNSIKFEENSTFQQRSAEAMAHFLFLCTSSPTNAKASPSDKILKNLCAFLCQDTSITPPFVPTDPRPIMSLPPTDQSASKGKNLQQLQPDLEFAKNKLVRQGAEMCFTALATIFGESLLIQLPKLWSYMSEALLLLPASDPTGVDKLVQISATKGQDINDALTVLSSSFNYLSLDIVVKRLNPLWSYLFTILRSSYSSLRHASARCITALCDILPVQGLQKVVEEGLPCLIDPHHVHYRRGGIELISFLVTRLDLRILPYIIFLIAPVLGRMTDSDEPTRLLATSTFASLIKLVPLEAGLPIPEGFSPEVLVRRDTERKFLTQLLDGSSAEPYEIPVKVNAELRTYQKAGVSWLAFLARYQLHGILCDDMGLGKTLQTIVILASAKQDRRSKMVGKSSDPVNLPSLVVCPPTLTGHWVHEISQYVDNLKAVHYTGDKSERSRILSRIAEIDVLVMSYDVARNDVEILVAQQWLFLVLDEGHVIKNAKTKLSQALRRLQAQHRLILSGTPVQNHVMELWSLFDFLMPGFLGTERVFQEKFGKPILASRNAKTSKEQEAGTLALEALHKQILPFLLRRMKDDVLDDLPPKIIQDYECEMSPLQKAMYELAANGASDQTDDKPSSHVFQSLQYLRKLVNHPLLVLNPNHQVLIDKFAQGDPKKLHELNQAPKLEALKQILADCGIGGPKVEDGFVETDEDVAAPHRVLIFAQLKTMLDLIETDLFAIHMPTLTYMRLDGSTPANKRHALVQRFNGDPSIDVLLLTTHVGGLGLTLTGADTVIFVEHDWNPSRDLQAMDRAHRMGQKRVVNVYRLITKNTIEEKIMGLQKFKMNIASSVVNDENNGLGTMDTDQVLDLFGQNENSGKTKRENNKKLSRKELLAGLGELEEDSVTTDNMAFAQSL